MVQRHHVLANQMQNDEFKQIVHPRIHKIWIEIYDRIFHNKKYRNVVHCVIVVHPTSDFQVVSWLFFSSEEYLLTKCTCVMTFYC